MKAIKHRSFCPTSLALDIFGDKWSLLIIRDMMLEGKHYFRQFLQSKEKIASNILASRLVRMESQGLIRKHPDLNHKQKVRYTLTEKGIDLFPVLLEMARWSIKYMPVDPEDAQKAKTFINGGMDMRNTHMENLKRENLVRQDKKILRC